MSNFSFLNHPEPMQKFEAYRRIYQYATNAENSYRHQYGECARYVRYTLEQFCVFVSDLKKIKYNLRPVGVASFYKGEKEFDFLCAVEKSNLDRIRKMNYTANSYMHSFGERDTEGYQTILEDLFCLLLWLYKQLGLQTKLTYSSFDYDKIPENGVIDDPILRDPIETSAAKLEDFQALFPACNMDRLCNVVQEGTHYIITDIHGKKLGDYVPEEELERSEREYSEKIQDAQGKIKTLLNERSGMEQQFRKEKNVLLGEIEKIKEELEEAIIAAENANVAEAESAALIDSMRSALAAKELQLQEQIRISGEEMAKIQRETKALLQEYQEKTMRLETLLQNVILENERYKQKAQQMVDEKDHNYLQVIHSSLLNTRKQYALYQQNANEKMLREYLLRVKNHYEQQIYDLEEENEALLLEMRRNMRKARQEREEAERERKMAEAFWRNGQIQAENQAREMDELKKQVQKLAMTEEYPRQRKRKKTHNFLWKFAVFSMLVATAVGLYAAVLMLNADKNKDDLDTLAKNETIESNVVQESAERVEEIVEEAFEESVAEIIESTPIESTQAETMEESVESQPSSSNKLDEMLAEREERNSWPKSVGEIEGVHPSLVEFIENDEYTMLYENRYAGMELLGEAYIYNVSPRTSKIYTSSDYEWVEFFWNTQPNGQWKDVMIMFVEPDVISTEFSRESSLEEIEDVLGEHDSEYINYITPSDFNFFEQKEWVNKYRWEFSNEDYKIYVDFFFSSEKIIDYAQVILESRT